MRSAVALMAVTLVLLSAAQAADPNTPLVTDSETERQWKELQAQEQWVSRLNKQVQGETKQLAEMRASISQKFKLDAKKLEAGLYTYDEKKDKFVEIKPVLAGEAKKQ